MSESTPWLDPYHSLYGGDREPSLGRLALKMEPAGKVRVFAMVDPITQSVLSPLHDGIARLLKSIPNDATFDQRASVNRCFEKSKKFNCSYGFDLSAATDRLPVSIQVDVLSSLIGREAATLWRDLLVGRSYFLDENEDLGIKPHFLKYAVGQPMGAKTS